MRMHISKNFLAAQGTPSNRGESLMIIIMIYHRKSMTYHDNYHNRYYHDNYHDNYHGLKKYDIVSLVLTMFYQGMAVIS